jgi:hypothetical protein
VDYATAAGTATSGTDFQPASGTLTIPALSTTGTVAVPVVGDTVGEPDETFFVNLGNATNASVGDGQGTGTIHNDEAFPRAVSIDDAAQAEGDAGLRNMTFFATLSPASPATVTVRYRCLDGLAVAGRDYNPVSGTLSFLPGETRKTIGVPIIGDRLEEQDEDFRVVLDKPVNTTLVKSVGVGTIVNDDGVTEGNAGTRAATFTVRLSRASTSVVMVRYQTADGTAKVADSDYAAKTGILSFAPGTTTMAVTVLVNGDTKTGEGDETFVLKLSGARNAAILDATGVGTIFDDDGP